MVRWIYVLECEDENIYIGQTTRLFRRFNEHINGNGSVNTGIYLPEKLVGLYKVGDNDSFIKYRTEIVKNGDFNRFTIYDWGSDEETNHLDVENHFTELYLCLRAKTDDSHNFMYNDGQWRKIKGGKYTKELVLNPTRNVDSKYIIDRPCCYCGYPCEVKISKDNKTIYYVCSLKNVWDDFFDGFEIGTPCDYYKIYEEDAMIKKQYELNTKKLGESWLMNVPKSAYKIHPEPCIKCYKENYMPTYAFGVTRRLCQSCFTNKYEDLVKQYSVKECLID
jgi:predicted GIY-YIG superfamily endonuclease